MRALEILRAFVHSYSVRWHVDIGIRPEKSLALLRLTYDYKMPYRGWWPN